MLENLNYETILDEQIDDIFKMIKADGKLSQLLQNATDRAVRVKRLQQFYTPEPIVRKMLDCSKLLKSYANKLKILEPSAGVADTVLGILKYKKNHHISVCEIDPKSRKVLQ